LAVFSSIEIPFARAAPTANEAAGCSWQAKQAALPKNCEVARSSRETLRWTAIRTSEDSGDSERFPVPVLGTPPSARITAASLNLFAQSDAGLAAAVFGRVSALRASSNRTISGLARSVAAASIRGEKPR